MLNKAIHRSVLFDIPCHKHGESEAPCTIFSTSALACASYMAQLLSYSSPSASNAVPASLQAPNMLLFACFKTACHALYSALKQPALCPLQSSMPLSINSKHIALFLNTTGSHVCACVQVCAMRLQHLFKPFRSCNSQPRQLDLLENSLLLTSFEDGCVRICDPVTAVDTTVTLPQLSIRSPRYVRCGAAWSVQTKTVEMQSLHSQRPAHRQAA